MDISEIAYEKYSALIITELKLYGVKCQKEKRKKQTKEKDSLRKIFCTHLHLLDITDVILANGKVVQIPKFLKVACSRVLEQVDTEGLFRKAGSIARQREIRASLENGEQLGRHHHVIDVANIIKYFFRELPLPLISPVVQEALVQCLLVRDNSVECMLLACLLLPLLTVNTLSFFMQFLHTVSLSENRNKMTVQNLAIVFTPALMPFQNMKSQRYMNHVKIVRILIENANSIGIIPARIERKLFETTKKLSATETLSEAKRRSRSNITESNGLVPVSAKKKRRSDLFHGLRKIVSSTMGSTELMDYSSEGNRSKLIAPISTPVQQVEYENPVFKEATKRKLLETEPMLKSKKKDTKKTRMSFGAERINKNSYLNPVVTSVERRWSMVGSTCSKYKTNKNAQHKICSDTSNCKDIATCVSDVRSNGKFGDILPFLTESKCEYREISVKDPIIEYPITKESSPIKIPLPQKAFVVDDKSTTSDHVQTERKVMPVETGLLASPATEQLVQCVSQKLYVRRSTNEYVSRNAETCIQTSQDNMQKSSWHIPMLHTSPRKSKCATILEIQDAHSQLNTPVRLNTPHTTKQLLCHSNVKCNEGLNEKWLPGEEFFTEIQTKKPITTKNETSFNLSNFEHVTTPVRHKSNFDGGDTQMLPPNSLPIKVSNKITPLRNLGRTATATKLSSFRSLTVSTPEEINGRASIARLREQNAGMVMAKAKLFDCLEAKTYNRCSKKPFETNSTTKTHCKMEKSENCNKQKDLILNQNNYLQTKLMGERIPTSAPNTPVNVSKQRNRIDSKLHPKPLRRSIATQDTLTRHYAVGLEYERKATKAEALKMTSNSRNAKSPRRPRK